MQEPDKSKYDILHGCKERNWEIKKLATVTKALAEKSISIHFKRKGQTDEIQGISFSKGEYTFKGSEIDRSFRFSKLDKYFGDVGLTTAGSNKQAICTPVQEPATNKSNNSLITVSAICFLFYLLPADETPDNPDMRKKKKKNDNLSYRRMEDNLIFS